MCNFDTPFKKRYDRKMLVSLQNAYENFKNANNYDACTSKLSARRDSGALPGN